MHDDVMNAKHASQHSGNGSTHHVRRDHAGWVSRGKGDRTFGDAKQAHKEGSNTGVTLLLGEQTTIDESGQAHAERGNRDGSRGQSHDLALINGNHAPGEEEGDLIDWTAHIEADHEANDDSEDGYRRRCHAGQEVG